MIYVDDMYLYAMGKFGRMKMSHLIGSDEDELHAFAKLLGLHKRWYQGDHYDVAMGVRAQAIAMGAVPIRLKELAAMVSERRRTGVLPNDPAGALARSRAAARARHLARERRK